MYSIFHALGTGRDHRERATFSGHKPG